MQPAAIAQWTFEHYGEATYRHDEMEHLAIAALTVPAGGTMVEIGSYGGCSASILLQAARGKDIYVALCDPCMWMWSDEVNDRLQATLQEFSDVPTVIAIPGTSESLAVMLIGPTGLARISTDLVHIDGDHSANMVQRDCELWLPRLNHGGLACFHDYRSIYGTDPFPGMPEEIDRQTQGWETVWHGGGLGLLIRRKP